MTLIVEDGIGRNNANTFATVDYARDYATARHRAVLQAVTDDVLEALLIRATDYIETRWGSSFRGSLSVAGQALSWPRQYAYDDDGCVLTGVPDVLKRATVELAERANGVDRLIPDPPAPYPVTTAAGTTADVTSGEVVRTRKKVEGLETETEYAHSGLRSTQIITSTILAGVSIQEFPQLAQLMKPLLRGGTGAYASSFIRH